MILQINISHNNNNYVDNVYYIYNRYNSFLIEKQKIFHGFLYKEIGRIDNRNKILSNLRLKLLRGEDGENKRIKTR